MSENLCGNCDCGSYDCGDCCDCGVCDCGNVSSWVVCDICSCEDFVKIVILWYFTVNAERD